MSVCGRGAGESGGGGGGGGRGARLRARAYVCLRVYVRAPSLVQHKAARIIYLSYLLDTSSGAKQAIGISRPVN